MLMQPLHNLIVYDNRSRSRILERGKEGGGGEPDIICYVPKCGAFAHIQVKIFQNFPLFMKFGVAP